MSPRQDQDGVWRLDLGSRPLDPSTVHFRLWAPRAKTVAVHVVEPEMEPVLMEPREFGYFEAAVPGVSAGARYVYVLDGEKKRADPASWHQPDGVHTPSAVSDRTRVSSRAVTGIIRLIKPTETDVGDGGGRWG